MIPYEKIKEELEREGKQYSVFFTKMLYETYLKEKEDSFKHFVKTGKWLTLTKSEQSEFYLKNGYGWCRMLEIICAHTPKWRIDFYENEWPYDSLLERRYMHFETKDMALLWAKAYKPDCIYEILEVEN